MYPRPTPGHAARAGQRIREITEMNRWHGWLALALVLVFAPAGAHAGAIYKCTIRGSTVYQDQPCSPGKPELGRLSGPATPSADLATTNNPDALRQGIKDASERGRQLHAQHDRELDQLWARMIGVTDEQTQRKQVGRFNRDWQQRFAENRRQQQALVARLKQLCPGGASGGSNEYACHPQSSRAAVESEGGR
jgi:hypothetical protein